MKKIKKVNLKITNEILELRDTRGPLDSFTFSFLTNFSEHARLMHSLISNDKNKIELYKIAYRQYFVFLISCWETYFRDTFVYVYSRNKELISALMLKMKSDHLINQDGGVTQAELLSKSFNFQNINDIDDAFDGVWADAFLDYICSFSIEPCGINGKIASKLSIENIFEDWRNIIESAFSIRHRVVHDANFRPELNVELISQIEALFLIVPQFVTYALSKRFNLSSVFTADNIPYIFSMHDILANDWNVIEN
ncbi:TPA: hypothetical protein SMN35_000254 [Proteus mirabilis]